MRAGCRFERSNRWADAERDFQAALKINPDRADVLNYLGYSWIEKGQHLDQAVAMLEKARALRPMDGFIADSVGWAYFRLGRYQDAVRTLEEAVQLAPGAADVNDHLGDAYWRVGRKIDARFQWQHALADESGRQGKAGARAQAAIRPGRGIRFGAVTGNQQHECRTRAGEHARGPAFASLRRPRSISFCMSAKSGPTVITRWKA